MKHSKIFIYLLATVLLLTTGSAQAGYSKNYLKNYISPNKYASLVVDAGSGTIIHQENADLHRYPASLTKLMTLYLTFESLKQGKFSMNDTVTVSRHAASQPRTNIALRPFEKVTIKNLVQSLVVVSANDSAVVLAEKIGRSEGNFARIMTQRAHQLGMKETNFVNASGLFNPKQITTAKDMAKLMMAMKRDFPQYYGMLSQKQFSYKGANYSSHTDLMRNYKGAKAAKTGYVRASGFNVVVGAEKNNKNLIAVVMGGITARSRDKLTANLLDQGFSGPRKFAANTR